MGEGVQAVSVWCMVSGSELHIHRYTHHTLGIVESLFTQQEQTLYRAGLEIGHAGAVGQKLLLLSRLVGESL